MRLASVAVLALVSSIALVGCSDGDGSISISDDDTSSTTTAADAGGSDDDRQALVDYLSDSETNIIQTDDAECVADTVSGLSADGYDVARDGDSVDFSDFSDDDAEALAAAIDECIDYDDLLVTFGEQMTAQAGLPLTEDEGTCAAQEFASEYAGAGEFVREVSALSDEEAGVKIFDALGPCMSDESAAGFVAAILVEEGETEELAQCVADDLVANLGAADLLRAFAEAGTSGEVDDLSTAMGQSLLACGGSEEDAGTMDTIPSIGGGLSGG